MSVTLYILGIVIQAAGGIIALLQVREAPRRLPWLLIAVSALLIVGRRAATLGEFISTSRELATAEILTLVISMLFLAGVILMRRMFQESLAAQAALRESENRFARAFEYAPIAKALVSPEGKWLKVNRAVCNLLGYSERELQSRTFQELTHPDDLADNTLMLKRMLAGSLNTYQTEKRYIHKDGHTVWTILSSYLIRDSKGDPSCFITQIVDISARKRAEKLVRRRKQYLTGLNQALEMLLISEVQVPFQAFIDHIGPAFNVDRAGIFINDYNSKGELLPTCQAFWCADKLKSGFGKACMSNLACESWAPGWKDALTLGTPVKGAPADFPNAQRAILEQQDIRNLLMIPIMLGREFSGFMRFDACRPEREWGPAHQMYLQIAANDLAHAIKRLRVEKQVSDSLREKEVLLREIHHRVKNNMQVIISLLRLHSGKAGDMQMEQVFNDCRDRIDAMALIHESLYQTNDFTHVDFNLYLNKLCRNLCRAYDAANSGIVVTVTRCSVSLNMDQGVAVGMVIAELISNACKHAFDPVTGGNVCITLTSRVRTPESEDKPKDEPDNEPDADPSDASGAQEVELIVADDGKGLPPTVDLQNPSSLGLRLVVAAVTRELGGSIEVDQTSGARFIIRFRCSSLIS